MTTEPETKEAAEAELRAAEAAVAAFDGGTLVHEMSHFTVVAGTDDWAYGQSAAAALAVSNPARAIENADSHEYFAENTPPLE